MNYEIPLSLVIPLWNEEKNISALIKEIRESQLLQIKGFELILVNNGSSDKTSQLISSEKKDLPWIVQLNLEKNRNYGGGIQYGIENSKNELVAFIPGDLQVKADDVMSVYKKAIELSRQGVKSFIVKGHRVKRFDGFSTRFVSKVYTFLANRIIGINTKDLNALPKLLTRDLYFKIKGEKLNTFVFDAQLLLTAKINKTPVYELPVTFYARREGVSSWSGKRFRVYMNSFKLLLWLRKTNLSRITHL